METYLRHRDVQRLTEERDHLRSMLMDPMKGVRIDDRPEMEKKEKALSRQIDEKVAPDLNPEQRDKIAKLEKELREKISVGMLSFEEMRKCPPGAIGQHMRWERENKNDILVWKNCILALNKGNDDPDIANVERLRPRTNTLNMDNALVPGTHYDIPSPQFTENYDKVHWKGKTPEEYDKVIAGLQEDIAEMKKALAERKGNGSGTKRARVASTGETFSGSCEYCDKEFTVSSPQRLNQAKIGHLRFCKKKPSIESED